MNKIIKTSLLCAGLLWTAGATMAQTLPSPPFPLFDSHTHFYTDDFSSYPLHPEHAYMGVKGLIKIVLDHPNTPAPMFTLWQQNGVEGGVGVQYSAAYQTDNRYILSVAHQYPRKVAPVVIIDTNAEDAPALLRRLVQQEGVTGIRLTGSRDAHGNFPWLDSPRTLKVWQVADELQLPVIVFPGIHGADSHAMAIEVMRKVVQLAQRFPHARIVLDHCGWMAPASAPDYGFSGVYQALAQERNVYFKVTSINFRNLQAQQVAPADFVRHAVDVVGADRVLWGSDLGNTRIPYPQMVSAAWAATSSLNGQERRQVLHDTGYRLFVRPVAANGG